MKYRTFHVGMLAYCDEEPKRLPKIRGLVRISAKTCRKRRGAGKLVDCIMYLLCVRYSIKINECEILFSSEYTVADVAAVDMVGSSPSSTEGTPVRSVPAAVAPGGELDELDRVLMGFDKGPAGRPPLPRKASVE